MAQKPVSDTKAELLAGLDAAFADLKARIPPAGILRPSRGGDGAWGAFEMLAHLSGWHLFSAIRLRQIAANQPPVDPGPSEEMNARFVADRSALSAAALLDDLQRSFDELRSAAESVAHNEYRRGEDGQEDSLAYFIINANGPEHYAEHLIQLSSDEVRAHTEKRGLNLIPEPLGKAQQVTEETAQRLLHSIENSQPVRKLRASQLISGLLGAIGFALFIVGIENAAQDFPVVSNPYGSVGVGIILLALTGLLLRQLTEGK